MKKEPKKEPVNVRMPPALFARPMFRLALDPNKASETSLGYTILDVIAVLPDAPVGDIKYAWPRYICLAYSEHTGRWISIDIVGEDHEDLDHCYDVVGGDHG